MDYSFPQMYVRGVRKGNPFAENLANSEHIRMVIISICFLAMSRENQNHLYTKPCLFITTMHTNGLLIIY